MSNQVIHCGYGKANMASVLATYAAMKVTPPFHRVSAATSGKRAGQQTVTNVGTWRETGVLISAPVEHPQGTIILLQTKFMKGPMLLRDGGLFLRLREGAPLYSIMANVPTGPENVCGDQFLMFSGNADILNADELRLVGLDVPRGYLSRYMDPEELQECYRIVMVNEGHIPRPAISAIATPTGVEMREIAQAPTRRLRIRGGGKP